MLLTYQQQDRSNFPESENSVFDRVIYWFEKSVLGLNLCPFAAKPYREGGIRFVSSSAQTDVDCLTDLFDCLNQLDQQPDIETMVLICPHHLQDFSDYNQFLDYCDALLEQQGWSGIYQIASFHPDYQFAENLPDDRANWTNRSPSPLLHLIREASISRAVAAVANSAAIPARNIQTIEALSEAQMIEIFGAQ